MINPHLPTDTPRLVGHLWLVGYLDTGWADMNASVTVVFPNASASESVEETARWHRAMVVHESPWAQGDAARLGLKLVDRFTEAMGWPQSIGRPYGSPTSTDS